MGLKNFTIVGLDVGGANIKAAKVEAVDDKVLNVKVIRKHFPIWIKGKESLPRVLEWVKARLGLTGEFYVALTMTAELSDVYRVKSEGVKHIIKTVSEVFKNAKEILVLNVKGKLIESSEALNMDPHLFAASNWVASGIYVGERISRNCFFVDIGSTSTTIVPIVNGKVFVKGFRDPEKLVLGELVYLGILRTNISAIVDKVPYKGLYARVSSEKFALMGDVVRVLGFISEREYTTETADGRGKSIRECWERLSRVPCADAEILSFEEVIEIARYIYEKAVERIFDAVMQLRTRLVSEGVSLNNFEGITAGIGSKLAFEALRRAGFSKIRDLSRILGKKVSSVFPAYALALITLRCLVHEETCGH